MAGLPRAPALLVVLAVAPIAADAAWRAKFDGAHYDVVVLGTGLKESLLSGLLATHGKRVLQLERSPNFGGSSASLDLQELSDRIDGPGSELAESRVGAAHEYSIDPAPKMLIASGTQMQMLVASGAWQHMYPPGFKRTHRSLVYRLRPDGKPDVHRVLANLEDVAKTRSLTALEKAKFAQFYLWIDKYNEDDPKTHLANPLSKVSLDLTRMSAAKFLKYWELSPQAIEMVTRGLALFKGPTKRLRRVAALELVRRVKRYKDAYRTFPHMTSPYVYPVGGWGSGLSEAMAGVLAQHDGACLLGRPIDAIAPDPEGGGGLCVSSDGATVRADCVVAGPEYAPEGAVAERYQVVRLYAVLAHPPNQCKDANSCQLLLPGAVVNRESDVFLVAGSAAHAVAPKGKWIAVASARVEGSTRGLEPMAVAKRELASVLPFLRPCKKWFAEVTSYCEPEADATIGARSGGAYDNLHVLKGTDETSYFDSVEADVEATFERITGESLANLRGPRAGAAKSTKSRPAVRRSRAD